MTIPENPPRGLRWTTTATAKGITTLAAMIAIAVAIFVGARQQIYITCIAHQQQADAVRTQRIAVATDIERAADQRLLAGPVPGGPSAEQLREDSRIARAHTDAVREANPPVPPGRC